MLGGVADASLNPQQPLNELSTSSRTPIGAWDLTDINRQSRKACRSTASDLPAPSMRLASAAGSAGFGTVHRTSLNAGRPRTLVSAGAPAASGRGADHRERYGRAVDVNAPDRRLAVYRQFRLQRGAAALDVFAGSLHWPLQVERHAARELL